MHNMRSVAFRYTTLDISRASGHLSIDVSNSVVQ